MLKHSLSAALVGGALIAAAGQPAHADDVRTYPGSMCVRYAGPSLGFEPLDFSSKVNISSEFMFVDCPIVKNNALPDETLITTAYVVDENSSQNVSCTLYAARRIGNGFVATNTPTRFSAGSGGGFQRLDLAPLAAPVGGGTVVTTWLINCALPPQTRILNYSVIEPSS